MNENQKILEIIEKDFLTLRNLEKSIWFAIKSNKCRQYQFKILYAAFRRTSEIMISRRKMIANMLGSELNLVKEQYKPEQSNRPDYNLDNPKHKIILRLLYELKLKPKQIINLKVKDYNLVNMIVPVDFIKDKQENDYMIINNRNKKYCVRTIQQIKKNNLRKQTYSFNIEKNKKSVNPNFSP